MPFSKTTLGKACKKDEKLSEIVDLTSELCRSDGSHKLLSRVPLYDNITNLIQSNGKRIFLPSKTKG